MPSPHIGIELVGDHFTTEGDRLLRAPRLCWRAAGLRTANRNKDAVGGLGEGSGAESSSHKNVMAIEITAAKGAALVKEDLGDLAKDCGSAHRFVVVQPAQSPLHEHARAADRRTVNLTMSIVKVPGHSSDHFGVQLSIVRDKVVAERIEAVSAEPRLPGWCCRHCCGYSC